MTGSYFYRKIILLVTLFAICAGGFFPVEKVEAETAAPTGQARTRDPNASANSNAAYATKQATVAGKGPNDAANSQQQQQTASASNSEISCFKWNEGFDIPACISIVTFSILGLCSWVLWVAAIFFNAVINYSLNMASVVNDIPIVALGWSTFRDIANLCFIFVILYIGISIIINHGGFNSKQKLIKVVAGAMLINFSLFFTQVAIDASNIMALQFYHKIINVAQNTTGGANANDLDSGISAAFTKALGMDKIFSIGGQAAGETANGGASSLGIGEASKLGLNSTNLLIASIGGIVLVLITALVFFAGALMMLVRTVELIFLMILSPVAVLGDILPAVGSESGKWWSKLKNNLLFAPAYMALLYLVISMIGKNPSGTFSGVTIDGKKYTGTFIDMFAGSTNMIGAVMTFAILIAMMLGCLIIASSFGAYGAKEWEKRGKGWAKSLGMTFSGANAALSITRNTAGGLGTFLSENKALAGAAARLPFGGLGAAALMQRGKKLKDLKIGPDGNNKSFNDVVKDKTKMYSERGNLIEGALKGPAGKEAEKRYLKGTTFSYASKTALSKAKKKSSAPKNKEALEALIQDANKDKGIAGGKFSKENYEKAQERISKIDEQIADTHKRMVGLDPKHQAAEMNALNSLESSLRGMKSDQQAIIKGYEDTVDKLDRIERSESKDK